MSAHEKPAETAQRSDDRGAHAAVKASQAPRGAAEALAAVQGLLADLAFPGAVIEPDSDLSCDLGLTSFDMMVVHVRLEELRGGRLSFDALLGVRTVANLARVLAER